MRFFGLRRFVYRWTHYEFWPWLVFFSPTAPYYIYLAIRARWFYYSTAANPGIDLGGLFGESKSDILDHFSEEFKPKTHLHLKGISPEETLEVMKQRGFEFPVILKPNIGERGYHVERVEQAEDLLTELGKHAGDMIIQEFVDYPVELGVLYGRIPGEEKGSIRSIVMKRFLSVTGDGRSSVEELLFQNPRAWFQMERLQRDKKELLNSVPLSGQELIVEHIGNHSRGTEFIDGRHLINAETSAVFDRIAGQFEGFYYGRFDLKVKSLEDFRHGNNIRIFELNGVTSEPGHIYDTRYSLFRAYRDIFRELHFIYRISMANIRRGIRPYSAAFITRHILKHFREK